MKRSSMSSHTELAHENGVAPDARMTTAARPLALLLFEEGEEIVIPLRKGGSPDPIGTDTSNPSDDPFPK